MSLHMTLVLSIILGAVIFLISYYSDKLYIKGKESRFQAKAFAAGVTLTYIFLELLPNAIPEREGGTFFFFFVLLGFAIFHIIEKIIFRHAKGKELRVELKREHTAAFALYHGLIGLGIAFFLSRGLIEGILFFIPVALHDLLSSASLRHVHNTHKDNPLMRTALSVMTLIGILIGVFFFIPEFVYQALIGFIGGTLLHIVVRDVIPRYRDGRPLYFFLGIITMIGFLTLGFFL